MNRAEIVRRGLDEAVPDPAIPLDHRDPFTLLVAVVLSAQCTDVRVNLVTPALFAVAPDPARMWALGETEVLRHIASCGLAPTKARNLVALSRQLVEQHGGEVPSDAAALEALPGVGHKTAGVVRVQAFGVPAFPVDTHVARLAVRWGLSPGGPGAAGLLRVEADLQRVWEPALWRRAHLQMIWFGRTFCPARGHRVEACPICARLAEGEATGRGDAPGAGTGL